MGDTDMRDGLTVYWASKGREVLPFLIRSQSPLKLLTFAVRQ
jgi:hypothetical protein